MKLGLAPPDANALHHHSKITGGFLRFERHGEFYRVANDRMFHRAGGPLAIALVWLALRILRRRALK